MRIEIPCCFVYSSCPHCLEQCLAHSWCSGNRYQVNEQICIFHLLRRWELLDSLEKIMVSAKELVPVPQLLPRAVHVGGHNVSGAGCKEPYEGGGESHDWDKEMAAAFTWQMLWNKRLDSIKCLREAWANTEIPVWEVFLLTETLLQTGAPEATASSGTCQGWDYVRRKGHW